MRREGDRGGKGGDRGGGGGGLTSGNNSVIRLWAWNDCESGDPGNLRIKNNILFYNSTIAIHTQLN